MVLDFRSMPYVRTARDPVPKFQPGARVQFKLGVTKVRGKIVEYRGPLALGRPLYRVEVPLYENYVRFYELPEEELKPV
jgi:hypothetical protein